jgi:hypothetical protein
MSKETVSWKEYVDVRFEHMDMAVKAAFASSEKAIDKANTASEKRFEAMNEFRGQLSDQQSTFMTRNEYMAQHQALMQKVQDVTDRMNIMSGRSSGYQGSWGVIVGAITVGAALVTIITMISNGKL